MVALTLQLLLALPSSLATQMAGYSPRTSGCCTPRGVFLCAGPCFVNGSVVDFSERDVLTPFGNRGEIEGEVFLNYSIQNTRTNFTETEVYVRLPTPECERWTGATMVRSDVASGKQTVLEDLFFSEDCSSFTKIVKGQSLPGPVVCRVSCKRDEPYQRHDAAASSDNLLPAQAQATPPPSIGGRIPKNNTWETTPIFWHSANASGPLDAHALDFLTTHRPAMITLEKSSMLNYPPLNSSGERKVLRQAGWINDAFAAKGLVAPPVLFYTCSMGWNLAPSEGNYDLYTKLPERLFLRDSNGEHCTVDKPPGCAKNNSCVTRWKIFDLSQPEMVERWLQEMVVVPLATGNVSGIFVDSANLQVGDGQWMNCNGNLPKAKSEAWNAAHKALLPHAQTLIDNTNGGGVVLANNMDIEGVNGRFFEQFVGGFDGFSVRGDIAKLQAEGAAERFTECHGSGPASKKNKLGFVRQLAAFLLGAHNRALFYASIGWSNIDGEGIGGLEQEWSWTGWHDELSRPLGPPLEPMQSAQHGAHGGMILSRRFAKGTNVSIYCKESACNTDTTAVACIQWADEQRSISGNCSWQQEL